MSVARLRFERSSLRMGVPTVHFSRMDFLTIFQHEYEPLDALCSGNLFLRCVNPKEDCVAVRFIKSSKEGFCLWVALKLPLRYCQ